MQFNTIDIAAIKQFSVWFVANVGSISIGLVILFGFIGMGKNYDKGTKKLKSDASAKTMKIAMAGGAIPTVLLLFIGAFDVAVLSKAADARLLLAVGGFAILIYCVNELLEVLS